MNASVFAAKLDATNLKLDATQEEIRALCEEARDADYASVCVYPGYISFCAALLKNSRVKVCTVIGFPHGCSSLQAKREEILHAQANGAKEVDIVINHTALRNGENQIVTDETVHLCETARKLGLISKVIVETCYLNEAQKLAALTICEQAGADFIKTSTGFGSGGATIEDVKCFITHRTTPIKVKASGGIRTLDKALALIEAGAERLGVSAAGNLLGELKGQKSRQ
ncbi:MAG: deoxyribose-phosphate aldolase [Lentimonas sp.]|jgi:deoxyribose-phosphate aldolase